MRIGIEGRVLTPRIGGIGCYAIHLFGVLLSPSGPLGPNLAIIVFTAPQRVSFRKSAYDKEWSILPSGHHP
jgi:hypothetical protein